MSHDYATSKKIATKTIGILAVITIGEVLFALTGKGYIIDGFHFPHVLISLVMISMSIVKAYLIVYEFMHMKYEIPGLVKSVLLPLFLLVWAIIAFLYEGKYWNNSRTGIEAKNKLTVDSPTVGMIYEVSSKDFQ
jgi:cytochrome c oxidase subunit IV